MVVYSVLYSVAYEGCDLMGVFASREQAMEFIRVGEGHDGMRCSGQFGIIESELGQAVYIWGMCDWVD